MSFQAQKKLKIYVLGDNCADIYQYGNVDRISPEAPVPVFQKKYELQCAGMAGNVVANLHALGVDVIDSGVIGTTTKTRLIDIRSKQQIVRIDNDVKSVPLKYEYLNNHNLQEVDAIVVSDYNKGVISYELLEKLIANCKKPIFIDTKKTDLARLQGAWVKINELEYSKITSECTGLIVTKGSEGATILHHDITLPAQRVEVADVCGAGDTFLAAMAYQYIKSKDIKQSIEFAIKASAVTVQHIGNYAPTLEEIK